MAAGCWQDQVPAWVQMAMVVSNLKLYKYGIAKIQHLSNAGVVLCVSVSGDFTKVPKKVCEIEFIQKCAYLELFWCHQNRINKVSVY